MSHLCSLWGRCYCQTFLGFSGLVRPTADALGVTLRKERTSRGNQPNRITSRSKIGGNKEERKVKTNPTYRPKPSANAVNRANTNSCVFMAPSTLSKTSALVVHDTVVAGAAAKVRCRASGLPWSTIAPVSAWEDRVPANEYFALQCVHDRSKTRLP